MCRGETPRFGQGTLDGSGRCHTGTPVRRAVGHMRAARNRPSLWQAVHRLPWPAEAADDHAQDGKAKAGTGARLMAVLPILRWPDPRLTTVCTPVRGDVRALAADMLDTMYAAPGRGLAGPQGCLSLPGATPYVARATEARLRWTDLEGALHEETLSGFAAICAQHEYDHLDGILTLDHLSPADRAIAEGALL